MVLTASNVHLQTTKLFQQEQKVHLALSFPVILLLYLITDSFDESVIIRVYSTHTIFVDTHAKVYSGKNDHTAPGKMKNPRNVFNFQFCGRADTGKKKKT